VSREEEAAAGESRDWPRALALFAAAFSLSAARPSVLIGVPLILLLLALPTTRLPAIIMGLLAALLAFGGGPGDGLWYAERAWALLLGGWFAALSLRWPGVRVFPRAAASVIGAAAVVATVLWVGPPSGWVTLEWLVDDRIRSGVGAGLEALRAAAPEQGGLSPALVESARWVMDFQVLVFPALLGLASLASLGVAWWLHARLTDGEKPVLRPVSEFRFNDQLVWVFIAGLAILIGGWGGPWGRAGSNTVVFMGALYAVRGAAVVLFVTGGVTFFGAAMLFLGLLFIGPVMFALALFIGLGDTWVDLRERLRRQPA
jgi:hypothetical protein